jgi:hypothetical protein
MNQKIYIVDREDQVAWYVDSNCISFCLNLQDKKKEVREWLEQMTNDVVVISGQGKMPRCGTQDHPTNMFSSIQRHQFRVYFADEQDAMVFKLRWGGAP